MTRVFVIARSEVVRAGLVSLLEQQSDSAVVVTGSSADSDIPVRADVQVILLDTDDPASGIAADPEGRETIPIVMLTEEPSLRLVLEGTRAGIRAALPRNATATEIVAAITAAASGLIALPVSAWDAQLTHRVGSPPDGSHREQLTPREMEVLRMLAEGHANKTIAWRLGISEHTVKFHISSIFAKLNASTRTEAVAVGVRLGLIML